ncbi:MAG: kynureninase [Luteibaculaceae bacterium]
MTFSASAQFAQNLDESDSLKKFRERFFIPQHNGKDCIYLTGNSLGLQPKSATQFINQELEDWAKFGVEGHFMAKRPWVKYHEFFAEPLAKIVGAKPSEVVAMNGLTTNLHLLMVSFYRPTEKKYKILCEGKAFPSDQYMLQSQVKYHGFEPSKALIEVHPRKNEHTLRTEDILAQIELHKDELALVFFGGVNYYTGQVLDMETITKKVKSYGIACGWDLAHGVGNIPLQLHAWDADFASWCSYKYLNSGPGSVSGIFVHEKHHKSNLPMFAGWWGHDKEERFLMDNVFKPIPTAEAWQLSNAPVFSMAPHLAALEIHNEAGIENLRKKSVQLNKYLRFILNQTAQNHASVEFEIITPEEEMQHGSQISVLMHGKGKALFNYLTEQGVIADWREPNVIRMAPVPLYNSFYDIFRFYEILNEGITR